MSKHKSEDYKIIAVKYYLENNTNYTKTCDIFNNNIQEELMNPIDMYDKASHSEQIKTLNQKVDDQADTIAVLLQKIVKQSDEHAKLFITVNNQSTQIDELIKFGENQEHCIKYITQYINMHKIQQQAIQEGIISITKIIEKNQIDQEATKACIISITKTIDEQQIDQEATTVFMTNIANAILHGNLTREDNYSTNSSITELISGSEEEEEEEEEDQ